MPSKDSQLNRRKIDSDDATLRASAREELLARALQSNPTPSGIEDGDEIHAQIESGPTGV